LHLVGHFCKICSLSILWFVFHFCEFLYLKLKCAKVWYRRQFVFYFRTSLTTLYLKSNKDLLQRSIIHRLIQWTTVNSCYISPDTMSLHQWFFVKYKLCKVFEFILIRLCHLRVKKLLHLRSLSKYTISLHYRLKQHENVKQSH
jgi:hypothetical protein